MKLISVLLLVVLLAGCNTSPPLLNMEQLDAYSEESGHHTFHVWYLYKEDDSFYYLKRRVGIVEYDYFRLSKKDVVINVEEEFPVVLKEWDIQRKN